MSHIFITHAPADREYVRKLTDHLTAQGLNTWINDQTDESPERLTQINKAIEEAAAVILIMSREAQTSQPVLRDLSTTNFQKKSLYPLLVSGGKWALLMGAFSEDVRQGQMPSADFIEKLLKHAPRQGDAKNLTPAATVAPAGEVDNPAFTAMSRPAAFRQLTDALRSALDAPTKPKKDNDSLSR